MNWYDIIVGILIIVLITILIHTLNEENKDKTDLKNEACQRCGYENFTDAQENHVPTRLECDGGPQIEIINPIIKRDKWGVNTKDIEGYRVICEEGGKVI